MVGHGRDDAGIERMRRAVAYQNMLVYVIASRVKAICT